MIARLVCLAAALCLAGCVAGNTTTHSWSCRAIGNEGCASISEIDRRATKAAEVPGRPGVFGAHAASWWDENRPTSVTRQDAPRREGDQTMRIVVAPYIDAQGDYHDRGQVFAVMRKAEWWIAPPAPGDHVTPATPAATSKGS